MGDASTKNSIREVDVAPGQGFDHKQPPGIHVVGISTHSKKHNMEEKNPCAKAQGKKNFHQEAAVHATR